MKSINEIKSIQWQWKIGHVKKVKEHIELLYGDINTISPNNFILVALVSPPRQNCFYVELLINEKDIENKMILDRVKKELDFYLLEKGEHDPWRYAKYHCSTTSNWYSKVHWTYFPERRSHMIFRKLESDFLEELKKGCLQCILKFERKYRKSFMVEIRDNFLDLYFLGHTIEIRKKKGKYYLIAAEEFNPKNLLEETQKDIVKQYGDSKWQICFDDIKKDGWFEDIMKAAMAEIVRHKKGNISEGVSEVNHFIDNRTIEKNGILIIDRQVVYPSSGKGRIDLLGLRRLPSGKFTFSVIELKNKNNKEIENVFSRQLKRYIDLVYEKYEDFRETYTTVKKQKVELRLLKREYRKKEIVPKSEISKKDIEGIVILDNYNIKGDISSKGLLSRALHDWSKVGNEYTTKLFLKTNVLDSIFFYDRNKTEELLKNYTSCNSKFTARHTR